MTNSISSLPQHENEQSTVLSLDAFVRSVGVLQGAPFSVFVGAGASISSGLPSAEICVWEWKRSIFLTNNPGLENQFNELSLPGIRRRIQHWLDSRGIYPSEGSGEEYGFYIQECFPIADDRRRYFQDKVRSARPHIGYQLLCQLAESGLVKSLWSTNFDALAARAAASFNLTPLEVGIDSQQRIRPPTRGELLCISLHGDYRYDALKNTPAEIQEQEANLLQSLIDETQTTPMIVVGYSGRDQSVTDALNTAVTTSGSGTLYWCGFHQEDPPDHIEALIRRARDHGRQAHFVPTHGFDDLMTRLALHCLQGEPRNAAIRRISALAPRDLLARQPFQVSRCRTTTLIKSNAFEIKCPEEVIQFDLKVWPKDRVWASLRATVGERPLVAVPVRKILALGTADDIRDGFGDNIKGPIERTPIIPADLKYEDGAVVSLMLQALVRSMSESASLKSDGKRMWRSSVLRTIRRQAAVYSVHEAVNLFFRDIGGVQHLILMPSLRVLDQDRVEASPEIANPIKHEILGYQHNREFNEAVNRWRQDLFPNTPEAVFEFPPNCGSAFKFRVRRSPAFGQIGLLSGGRSPNVPEKMKPLIKYEGMQLPEPPLAFSNKAGTATTNDTHPIRGILNNRPYDFPLTSSGLSTSLRIGVVCPESESDTLHSYLQNINSTQQPQRTERDYLLDYPGFQTAYGLPVHLPTPKSPGWAICPNPVARDPVRATLEVARLINSSIETLQSSYAPDVVIIFFPERWQAFREYSTESENFDTHNFVKAFCVQHGISTQFLEQNTLSSSYQCRVWWWLSLALYVKGMRTPWLLNNLADDTAFVGLGFGIDRSAQRGDHIVLGCSHMYSTRGEGLQYRLSKVENPIIRRGNPFMPREDAHRVGETIRQLFFNARGKLPNRVVLHKRTPFTNDEREGLRGGLSGVQRLDMIEIQIDNALRYIAAKMSGDKLREDGYPVCRGTLLKLDDYRALLWVHGVTDALDPRLRYFQGKRRIPAPLKITRHAGHTPLQDLAGEILGLSKMNWNTFDLYTKLPATLQSSSEIAKIGSLLQRFGTESYDYRLFI